ncbi:hypothetical protein [Streptomyces jumonjinensis]|uniref:hypothetical protein n=1 Tax=Streptomyces jumonjinensis TaxID=1945 RepID=UPI003792A682
MWEGRLGGLFGRNRRRTAELAGIEAEITAFGTAVDEHAFAPGQPGATDGMRADLARALDAYDEAKRAFTGDRDRDRADALDVLRALDEGRHALACLDARLAGAPLPARLPRCFFDPRHGPSTTEVVWSPAEGAARRIAVCAADAVRLADGRSPMAPPSRTPAAVRTRNALPPAPRGDRAGRETAGAGPGLSTPRIALPVVGEPAVLVFRTEHPTRVTLGFDAPKKHGPPMTYALTGGPDPVVALVPLVRSGNRSVVRFSVDFPQHDHSPWHARSEPLDTVPVFDDSVHGHGYGLLHYTGEPGPAVLRHRGRGPVQLQALDGDLAEGTAVAATKGDGAAAFVWPGPGFYQVRSRGAWALARR